MTEIAIKILTLVLESLTAQTARDVLAAGYSLASTMNCGIVWPKQIENSFDHANLFMAELRKRHAEEAQAAAEAKRRAP